jgi:hypothetical protein
MENHEWRENTEDGTRFYRAHVHAGKWRFQESTKKEPDWVPIEKPNSELWLILRDKLWKKYQRKRGSWEVIEKIDFMLEKDFGIKPNDDK